MRHVKMKNLTKILIILICFTNCQNRETTKDNNCNSDIFYESSRKEFLKGDLKNYSYNPRTGFTKQNFDEDLFRVILRQDSSIRVEGIVEFNKEFNLTIDTAVWNYVFISKHLNGDLTLSSADNKVEQIIKKTEYKIDPVSYFIKLKKNIESYRIIAIEKHQSVNTIKLIFSDHDYLIYKPDTLKFKTDSKEFMTYLFQDSIRLDRNWYQFKTKINTDYN